MLTTSQSFPKSLRPRVPACALPAGRRLKSPVRVECGVLLAEVPRPGGKKEENAVEPQINGNTEWKKIEIVNGKKLTTKQQSTQDRLKSVPPAEHRRVQEEKAVEFTEEELKTIAFLDAKLADLKKEEEKAVETQTKGNLNIGFHKFNRF